MSLWDMLSGIGSIGAGLTVADDIRGVGADAAAQMGELSSQLQADTAFKGYGVTSGLGTSTVNADGSTTLGVGPNATQQAAAGANQGAATSGFNNAMLAAMGAQGNPAYQQAMAGQTAAQQGLSGQQAGAFNASQQAMANSMMDTGAREQQIYDRAMAMQQPMLDQQRGQHMAREAATGRRGVMGSAFGGTGEDAAMARAQAQAQNEASFQAMGQAQNEMMNQANMANMYGGLGQGYAGMQSNIGSAMGALGAQQAQLGQGAAGLMGNIANQQGNFGMQQYQQSFTPMQMQMQLMGLGGQNADRFQTGQITGANHAAQLGLGGIQAQINAETTAADMYSKLLGAGLTSMTNIGSGMMNDAGQFDWKSWLLGGGD